MPKKKEPSTVEKKETFLHAHEKLSKFLKEQNIILDYITLDNPSIRISDGILLNPKERPLVKIIARYGPTATK